MASGFAQLHEAQGPAHALRAFDHYRRRRAAGLVQPLKLGGHAGRGGGNPVAERQTALFLYPDFCFISAGARAQGIRAIRRIYFRAICLDFHAFLLFLLTLPFLKSCAALLFPRFS